MAGCIVSPIAICSSLCKTDMQIHYFEEECDGEDQYGRSWAVRHLLFERLLDKLIVDSRWFAVLSYGQA